VASYVSVLDADVDLSRGGSGIPGLLTDSATRLESAGALRPVAAFVRSQIRMQVRRWAMESGR
jgi:hypothetical protein